ncbi:hypothetical protein CAI16_11695 [Virgibacillus dokdonensis]|uniref:Uncharacterized protein n=2 Tax=Virgibacillus dokdonensis TaxID=302167 RepID=A0A3E0WQS0_9BACI|nr:hypothetical protein CAI16_11695 [Virgibacillus dokdonensis]
MTVFEGLVLMISFGTLIVAILSQKSNHPSLTSISWLLFSKCESPPLRAMHKPFGVPAPSGFIRLTIYI